MPYLGRLDERISNLERKVIGNNMKIGDITSTITDSLLQAQTMITSALSCRDSINSVMQRMVLIDEYLDPMYVAQMIDVECKMTYILEMQEKLKETYKNFQSFNKLQGMLDSDNINKLIASEERIKSASVGNAEINDMGMKNTQNIVQILVSFHDIMQNIKSVFRQMNILLTNLESGEQKVLMNEE